MSGEVDQKSNAVQRRMQRKIQWHRKLFFTVLAVFLGIVLVEGMCGLVWFIVGYAAFQSEERITQKKARKHQLDQELEAYHCEYDEELGWVHIPGFEDTDFYAPGKSMTINADGLRGKVDYIGKKSETNFRVVCLGDSMTMGFGVGDTETYPAQLDQLNPGVQAINMGMGDYSTCQFGVWYRRLHEKIEADLLIFAFITADVFRNNTPNRPNFRIVDRRVEVINRPVPKRLNSTGATAEDVMRFSQVLQTHTNIGRSFSYFASKAPLDDPLELTRATILELAALMKESRKGFAIVHLPHASEVPKHYAYNFARVRTYREITKEVQQAAEEVGVPYLDLGPTFASLGESAKVESLFLREYYAHYSPAGNQFVAEQLDAWLADQFPDYPRRSNE